MIDKEKIEEGVDEYYPYLEGKEMIHPINYQRAKQRDAFFTGVEWALKQVKNNGVLDDVNVSFLCDFVNQFVDMEISEEAIKESLEILNKR